MLNVNIKATNIEITPDITDYLTKKLSALEKFIKESDSGAEAKVEIGKTTNHQLNGNIFFTEINFHIDDRDFRVRSELDSLMASMDKAKDLALLELRKNKDKNTEYSR